MKSSNLPYDLQEFLVGCPKAGDGVNRWIFRAALNLHRAGVPEADMPALIQAATKGCGRTVTNQEMERAIINGGNFLRNGNHAEHRAPKWPHPNEEQIAAIVRDGSNLDELKHLSPTKWNDCKPHVEEIVDHLFPRNPLLCIALSKYQFKTKPRELWRGRLARRQFIVPTPMTKIVGMTKDGKPSEHTLDNTGPRRFLIVEFDAGNFDRHAAVLVHLAQYAPFIMAVHSGSKSLHGWFYVHGQPETKIERFFRYSVSLGADPQLWIRSQFVRLPDGLRENGKRQSVIYFNPSLINDNDKI